MVKCLYFVCLFVFFVSFCLFATGYKTILISILDKYSSLKFEKKNLKKLEVSRGFVGTWSGGQIILMRNI